MSTEEKQRKKRKKNTWKLITRSYSFLFKWEKKTQKKQDLKCLYLFQTNISANNFKTAKIIAKILV